MSPAIRNMRTEVLSDNWYVLRKISFEIQLPDGSWQGQSREAYDRGNGAAILLYNRALGTVILTRQFRMPTYVNGNPDGMLIEVCAGLLDKDHPEVAIRREVEEETGFTVSEVRHLFDAYMSPGSVTEILHFFAAEYAHDSRAHAGGGVADEGEQIEVLELPLAEALAMIERGEIRDAKTIMLLQYAQIHRLLE
ncbi:GDP-mannose pyrophosphatase NudK [Niveibacterium sp. SC-1]|uniref:GDP-mannose pyrophosphatase NudK n=1 Tax=Niveibacterium sp. SC-1 TaxID=3135646 RepID=UPI00311F605A